LLGKNESGTESCNSLKCLQLAIFRFEIFGSVYKLHVFISYLAIAVVSPSKYIAKLGLDNTMSHAYRYTFDDFLIIFTKIWNLLRLGYLFARSIAKT
jgi:hypothetical protein